MAFKKKKESTINKNPDDVFGADAEADAKTEKVTRKPLTAAAPRKIVDLERRKLTRKQTEQIAAKWTGDVRASNLDIYMQGMVGDARRKYGADKVYAANATSNLIIGIPCPSLAFEYLIAQDVFPLGLILQLVGPPGAGKSTLLNELYRWFVMAGGAGNHFEVETKMSPDLLPSIVGQHASGLVSIDFCDSVEAWQSHLMFWLKEHKTKMTGTKENPGPGRTIPILFGVDSIMGKPAMETQERVHKQGHGSRAHPVEAIQITQWIKTIPTQISGWPFAIVLNNHLKLSKDENGNDERRTGGGKGTNFQESFELEVTVKKSRIYSSNWDGRVNSIKCWKNSFGPTFRSINTRVLWWEEEDTENPGTWQQKTVFDWHWSTIDMLNNLQGREAQALKKVFHLKVTQNSDVENRAWSATLGMKEKDAVSFDELGKMISANVDVLDAIRLALGIKRRPLLNGDYLQQMDGLATELI